MLFLCFLLFVSVVIFTKRREAWLISYNTIYFIPVFIAILGTSLVLIELKLRNITQYKTNNILITFIILTFLSLFALPSIKWAIWLSVDKPHSEFIEIKSMEIIKHHVRPTEYLVLLQSSNIQGSIQVSKSLYNSLKVGEQRQFMYNDTQFGIILKLNKN